MTTHHEVSANHRELHPALNPEQQALAALQDCVNRVIHNVGLKFSITSDGRGHLLPNLTIVGSEHHGALKPVLTSTFHVNARDKMAFNKEVVQFSGKMSICTDGSSNYGKVDPTHQDGTAGTFRGKHHDPDRVPYIVIPLGSRTGAKMGDIAMVEANGKHCYAIVGDKGPANKLGEASVLVAKKLGIFQGVNSDAASHGVKYTILKNTSEKVATLTDITKLDQLGEQLFRARHMV